MLREAWDRAAVLLEADCDAEEEICYPVLYRAAGGAALIGEARAEHDDIREIKRHFSDRRWQIRVRRQDQELLLEMRAAEETLTQQLSRAPHDRELTRHLSVTEDDVLQARKAHQAFTACSLDASLSYGDDPGPLADVLGEDDPAVAHATDIEAVRAHLDELPERDQRILMLRFYGNLTQEQIGDRLGISQMHVSRLLDRH